jgi:hypothetical protein
MYCAIYNLISCGYESIFFLKSFFLLVVIVFISLSKEQLDSFGIAKLYTISGKKCKTFLKFITQKVPLVTEQQRKMCGFLVSKWRPLSTDQTALLRVLHRRRLSFLRPSVTFAPFFVFFLFYCSGFFKISLHINYFKNILSDIFFKK